MSKRIVAQRTSYRDWFYRKAQANARQVGTYQAARNLRKQGVPLAILAGRLT